MKRLMWLQAAFNISCYSSENFSTATTLRDARCVARIPIRDGAKHQAWFKQLPPF